MELWIMITIGAAVAAGIVGAAVLLMRSKRLNSEKQTIRLQQGFGPEYARALGEQGRSAAEADLLKREQVADLIKVRPLSATEVTRYSESWTSTQAQFVTNPGGALSAADHLVGESSPPVATRLPTSNRARTRSRLTLPEPSRTTARRTRSCSVTRRTPSRRTPSGRR